MSRYHLSLTHLWSEQEVRIEWVTCFRRRCQLCERDFVRSLENGEWRAVHVGIIKFDFLEEPTTHRWVSQDCPGQKLPGEGNEERM